MITFPFFGRVKRLRLDTFFSPHNSLNPNASKQNKICGGIRLQRNDLLHFDVNLMHIDQFMHFFGNFDAPEKKPYFKEPLHVANLRVNSVFESFNLHK